MSETLLSILMPALSERCWELLHSELMRQVRLVYQPVQVLVELDCGERSSGSKRQALLDKAAGKYICYVDDDDRVSADYVQSLVNGCMSDSDVVTFNLQMHNAQKKIEIWKFGLVPNDRRNGLMCVNHLCAWKKTIASKVAWVPQLGYWDDHFWFEPLFHAKIIKSQFHVNDVLYYYDFDPHVTVNQRRERVLISREYAGRAGVPCFKDVFGEIYIGDGGDCLTEKTARVRNRYNEIVEIELEKLYLYHTIKVL